MCDKAHQVVIKVDRHHVPICPYILVNLRLKWCVGDVEAINGSKNVQDGQANMVTSGPSQQHLYLVITTIWRATLRIDALICIQSYILGVLADPMVVEGDGEEKEFQLEGKVAQEIPHHHPMKVANNLPIQQLPLVLKNWSTT